MDKSSVAERGKAVVTRHLDEFSLELVPGDDARRKTLMRVSDKRGRSCPVAVRTVNGGGWQLSAERYLKLEVDAARRSQQVLGLESLEQPQMIVVYAWLAQEAGEEDRVFVLNEWMVQALVYRTYRWTLRNWGWTRPRKPESTHCALWPKDLEAFEDDWDLIREELGQDVSSRLSAAIDPAREPEGRA